MRSRWNTPQWHLCSDGASSSHHELYCLPVSKRIWPAVKPLNLHPPAPLRWDQGADDINDLQSQKHAAALASYLRLPPIKHDKFVNALLTAGSP